MDSKLLNLRCNILHQMNEYILLVAMKILLMSGLQRVFPMNVQ